jgi:hypothetical protein
MYFTDGQMYGTGASDLRGVNEKWNLYKSRVNPNAKLYLFNLQSYGQSAFDLRQNDTYMITGWNDKVFKIFENIERGADALAEIREVRL